MCANVCRPSAIGGRDGAADAVPGRVNRREGGYTGLMTLGEAVLAVLLPPLAVFLKKRLSRQFWIACVLTLLGHLPGVVYALVVTTQES